MRADKSAGFAITINEAIGSIVVFRGCSRTSSVARSFRRDSFGTRNSFAACFRPLGHGQAHAPLRHIAATSARKRTKAKRKRKYYENLARDLMDPVNAKERDARRFDLVMQSMDNAKNKNNDLPVQPRDHEGIVAWWSFPHVGPQVSRAHTIRETAGAMGKASQHGSTCITICWKPICRFQMQCHRRRQQHDVSMSLSMPLAAGRETVAARADGMELAGMGRDKSHMPCTDPPPTHQRCSCCGCC